MRWVLGIVCTFPGCIGRAELVSKGYHHNGRFDSSLREANQ